jgi:hypothetical protein
MANVNEHAIYSSLSSTFIMSPTSTLTNDIFIGFERRTIWVVVELHAFLQLLRRLIQQLTAHLNAGVKAVEVNCSGFKEKT